MDKANTTQELNIVTCEVFAGNMEQSSVPTKSQVAD